MKMRTFGFVIFFCLIAEMVSAVVAGILGALKAIEIGNTYNLPSPYLEIFWIAIGLAAVTMLMIGPVAVKLQDHHWLSRVR